MTKASRRTDSVDEPVDSHSVITIADDVQHGRRTATDVVEQHLARIAKEDPALGAFQVVCAAEARREARALDLRSDLESLPLAGVPVAIKDNLDVRGLPTRHGSAATSAAAAASDDELVARLRRAGAIVVGKTRMPELAIWAFTESVAYGGTRNPLDPTRNAGGSTGGGAAAVAAGMAPLAIGSDGGGSLRIPAANCGVVGLKPGRGVVPLAKGAREHWYGCTAFGPIAASVADASFAMDVLAGRPPSPIEDRKTSRMRIAVSTRPPTPFARPDAVSRRAVAVTVEAARTQGHDVRTAHPPYPMTLINTWGQHWLAGVALDADELGLDPAATEARTQSAIVKGRRFQRRGRPDPTAADSWRKRVLGWLSSYDVLITPTVALPAPGFGWADGKGYLATYLNAARGIPFTQAWNLAGLPAINIPVTAAGGRGVQLIAADEATLVAAAHQVESALRVNAPAVLTR